MSLPRFRIYINPCSSAASTSCRPIVAVSAELISMRGIPAETAMLNVFVCCYDKVMRWHQVGDVERDISTAPVKSHPARKWGRPRTRRLLGVLYWYRRAPIDVFGGSEFRSVSSFSGCCNDMHGTRLLVPLFSEEWRGTIIWPAVRLETLRPGQYVVRWERGTRADCV